MGALVRNYHKTLPDEIGLLRSTSRGGGSERPVQACVKDRLQFEDASTYSDRERLEIDRALPRRYQAYKYNLSPQFLFPSENLQKILRDICHQPTSINDNRSEFFLGTPKPHYPYFLIFPYFIGHVSKSSDSPHSFQPIHSLVYIKKFLLAQDCSIISSDGI